ncbi:MAG TPA: hypothetical protein VKS60_04915 [Stellaceae bacterium]|nr:hypothetical protein [Stellaceae bacterium]
MIRSHFVMAGLDPAIHVVPHGHMFPAEKQRPDVDGRVKPGHDAYARAWLTAACP